MSMLGSDARAFSAPGKALLVGGYLVLDPQYKAYVIGLSARMHAVIRSTRDDHFPNTLVLVKSAQFDNQQWKYTLNKKTGFVPIEETSSMNPFIEQTLFNVFNYFFNVEKAPNVITIDIYSDAEYHSQEETTIKCNDFKEFNFHEKNICDVPKTGLGSSAGLVVVLTAALTSIFKADFNPTNKAHQNLIHNLAQVAHCQAQGKIGSGFDVAAATYGSIIYRRFHSEIIADLPSMNLNWTYQYHKALCTLVDIVDWGIFTKKVRLPRGFKLVMGDIKNGSETVKLVSKVKEWYKSNLPESHEIYERINKANIAVMDALEKLTELDKNNHSKYNQMLISINMGEENIDTEYEEIKKLKDAVHHIRKEFKQITEESGASIEPEVQTKLINSCLNVKGVITGVVPGAGGYDAICLITTIETDMEYQTKGNPDFQNVSWLKLRQSDTGLLEENPLHYENLVNKYKPH